MITFHQLVENLLHYRFYFIVACFNRFQLPSIFIIQKTDSKKAVIFSNPLKNVHISFFCFEVL